MLTTHERALALQLIAKRLSWHHEGFFVDGDIVRGPGTMALWIDDTCNMTGVSHGLVHLDVTFALNFQREESFIRDCAAAGGQPREQGVGQAVDVWLATTVPPVITLLNEGVPALGAVHLRGADPGGIPGWHSIAGPEVFTTEGQNVDLARVKEFLSREPLLPRVASAIPAYERPMLNGVKLLCGSVDGAIVCEVRVNGQRREEASAVLASLPWPSDPRFWMFRQFTLLLAREPS